MKTFIIKITGGGTREDISHALLLISKSILNTPIEDIDGAEWEDCTLMTEIYEEPPIMGDFDENGDCV